MAAVQTDNSHHPQLAVLSPLKGFTRVEMARWAKEHIAPQSLILSDGLDCFKLIDSTHHHRVCNMTISGKSTVDSELKWVNTILGNIKTSFSGALHAFDFKKYCGRYLGNMQFRFNHRFNLKECFFEVLSLSVLTEPKPAKTLYSQGAH